MKSPMKSPKDQERRSNQKFKNDIKNENTQKLRIISPGKERYHQRSKMRIPKGQERYPKGQKRKYPIGIYF